jgi:acetamidase/formamidase
VETALEGSFEVIVREDLGLTYPRAETPIHRITMGMAPDLDDARAALRRTIDWVSGSTTQAFMLMSLMADVTQLVNEHKGIHVMLPKSALEGLSRR